MKWDNLFFILILVILFLVVESKASYVITNGIGLGTLDEIDCRTPVGIVIHAFIYGILVFFMIS